MTRTLLVALVAPLLPSLACMPAMMAGHAVSPGMAAPPGAPRDGGADAAMMQACPMAVPGTQVAVSDTAGGEALTFTTAGGDVGELRRRTSAMAAMHDRMGAGARMEQMQGGMAPGGGMMGPGIGGGSMGGGQGGGGHGMTMPPSRAAVEDVENGARIVVTPNDPADLERVRSAVRMRAKHMQQRGCEMMGGM